VRVIVALLLANINLLLILVTFHRMIFLNHSSLISGSLFVVQSCIRSLIPNVFNIPTCWPHHRNIATVFSSSLIFPHVRSITSVHISSAAADSYFFTSFVFPHRRSRTYDEVVTPPRRTRSATPSLVFLISYFLFRIYFNTSHFLVQCSMFGVLTLRLPDSAALSVCHFSTDIRVRPFLSGVLS